MKKTDGREVEEQKKHDDERSTSKMDKDKEYADKDNEHEICVSSRNTNKSSARYDFLRDVAQCQVDVAMFQETQQWHHEDRAAAEVGWSTFHLAKEGKTAIAVRKKNMNLLKLAGRSTRWVLIVLASILFPSLHLPLTWSGELNLEEYYKTLSEVDIKQNFHMSAIIAVWQHSNSNSTLKGKPKAESDECGSGRVIVESLEAAEDVMGEVSIDEITECIPKAARAGDFGSAGWEKQMGKEDNRAS